MLSKMRTVFLMSCEKGHPGEINSRTTFIMIICEFFFVLRLPKILGGEGIMSLSPFSP